MEIVFDPAKRLSSIAKHDSDFAALTIDFFEGAAFYPVKTGRFMAIGAVKGLAVTVIFAQLGSEAITVISMRCAGRKERLLYDQ